MTVTWMKHMARGTYYQIKQGNEHIAQVKHSNTGFAPWLCLRCVGNGCVHTECALDYMAHAYAEDATRSVAVAA